MPIQLESSDQSFNNRFDAILISLVIRVRPIEIHQMLKHVMYIKSQ